MRRIGSSTGTSTHKNIHPLLAPALPPTCQTLAPTPCAWLRHLRRLHWAPGRGQQVDNQSRLYEYMTKHPLPRGFDCMRPELPKSPTQSLNLSLLLSLACLLPLSLSLPGCGVRGSVLPLPPTRARLSPSLSVATAVLSRSLSLPGMRRVRSSPGRWPARVLLAW